MLHIPIIRLFLAVNWRGLVRRGNTLKYDIGKWDGRLIILTDWGEGEWRRTIRMV